MVAFKFNMEDLNCNRAGELSDSQKARFFKDAAMAFFAIFLGGLALSFVLWNLPYYETPFIVTALIPIVFTSIGILAYWLNMRPARDGIVASATGALSLLPHFIGGNAQAFSIGNESFAVAREVFKVFEWEVDYKIYYTPAHKIILTIEKLD